jgi:hypothetical protein
MLPNPTTIKVAPEKATAYNLAIAMELHLNRKIDLTLFSQKSHAGAILFSEL